MELTKEDWEKAKTSAETMLKQAMVDVEVSKNLLNTANAKLCLFEGSEKGKKTS